MPVTIWNPVPPHSDPDNIAERRYELALNGGYAAPGPAYNGLLAWNVPAYTCDVNRTPTAATIHLGKILVPQTTVFTNLLVTVNTAGNNYTNTQVGLYSSAGVLLGYSAVLASGGTNTFGTTGTKTLALTVNAGQSLTVEGSPSAFVWGAIHMGTNGATAVQLAGVGIASAQSMNMGLSAANCAAGAYTGHASNALVTIGNLTPASIDPNGASGTVLIGVT